MSFTTRCPACGTMFKVVPDQLKISDGWVRCGHCSDVFDAMLNLQSETPPPPVEVAASAAGVSAPPSAPVAASSRVVIRRTPIASPPAPVAAPAPALSPPPPQPLVTSAPENLFQETIPAYLAVDPFPSKPAPRFLIPQSPPFESATSRSDQGLSDGVVLPDAEMDNPHYAIDKGGADDWDSDWLLSPSSISRHREEVALELQSQKEAANQDQTKRPAQPVDEAFSQELHAIAGISKEPAAAPWPEIDHNAPVADVVPSRIEDKQDGTLDDSTWPSARPDLDAEEGDLFADPNEPTFVVQARREAFWRSPAMRAVLLLLAVCLSALLGMQWADFERDQLAARYPALEPALKQLCAATGCSLAAPRRIEAVAIDSSTLTRKLGQFYSFDLVLKNSEPMAVAMPALELSLTDASDKEIARRIFLPEEMPGTPTTVPANGQLSVNMRLSLSENDLGSMAGYRALVFYP